MKTMTKTVTIDIQGILPAMLYQLKNEIALLMYTAEGKPYWGPTFSAKESFFQRSFTDS